MRPIFWWTIDLNNIHDPVVVVAVYRGRGYRLPYPVPPALDAAQRAGKRSRVCRVLSTTAVLEDVPTVHDQAYHPYNAYQRKRNNNERLASLRTLGEVEHHD